MVQILRVLLAVQSLIPSVRIALQAVMAAMVRQLTSFGLVVGVEEQAMQAMASRAPQALGLPPVVVVEQAVQQVEVVGQAAHKGVTVVVRVVRQEVVAQAHPHKAMGLVVELEVRSY